MEEKLNLYEKMSNIFMEIIFDIKCLIDRNLVEV